MQDKPYTSLTLPAVCARLKAIEAPLILFHVRPDGDAVASAEALAHLFRLLGKPAACFCPDPVPERLAFLTENSAALPYDPDKHYTGVSVDIASPSRLGEVPVVPGLMIDHHAAFTPFADYYSVPDAAATGEILFEIALYMKENGMIEEIPPRLATLLYAAIASDSGGFRYQNTTDKTHLAAACLLSLGAETERTNHLLFTSKTLAALRAEAIAVEKLMLFENGKTAVILLKKEELTQNGFIPDDFETAVDVARAVKGVTLAATVKEETKPLPPDACPPGKQRYHISLRSTERDVAVVAAAFGGGGHVRAAGFTLYASGIEEARDTLLDALKKQH